MKSIYWSVVFIAMLVVGASIGAQPSGIAAPEEFRSDFRLQGIVFGNFFYVPDDQGPRDIRAIRAELRSGYRPGAGPLMVYTHVNYLAYRAAERDPSYGVRLGVAAEDELQNYNLYVDRGENRATVDVADTVAIANVTTLGGEYARRITPDWQLGADAIHERQRFDVLTNQENEYTGLAGSVRYRGFGYKFSPTVGYGVGHRHSADPAEASDERWWFAQVAAIPHPRVYLSLRYRQGTRDYLIDDPSSSNFDRHDDRPNWTALGTVKFTNRVSGLVYYSRTDVDASIPNRDVGTSYLILGISLGL